MALRFRPPGGDWTIWAAILLLGGITLVVYSAWKGPLSQGKGLVSLALGGVWIAAAAMAWYRARWARWGALAALVGLVAGLVWLNYEKGPGLWLIGCALMGKAIWDAWRELRPNAEAWMSEEEARRTSAEIVEKYHVTLGEPQRVDKEELLRLLAGEKAKNWGTGARLSITMRAPIQPIERGERFEDPLQKALGDLGTVHGGGSVLRGTEGAPGIAEVSIGVSVKDLEQGLAIIRRCLKSQGAPQDTVIEQTEPERRVFPLEG